MTKNICSAVLVALAILAGSLPAHAWTNASDAGLSSPAIIVLPTAGQFTVPLGKNGVADDQRKWSQPKSCGISASATAVACEAHASGFITSIEVSSGAIGAYAVALDTGDITSASALAPVAGQLLTTQRTCEYTLATTGLNSGACGVKEFSEGRPFHNGLTVVANDATTKVIVTYRLLRQ